MRKPTICIGENKDADQLRGSREVDQCLCFHYMDSAISILNPKFPASSHLQCLCSSVCVGPGRKPRRPVFSQCGSSINYNSQKCYTFLNTVWLETTCLERPLLLLPVRGLLTQVQLYLFTTSIYTLLTITWYCLNTN